MALIFTMPLSVPAVYITCASPAAFVLAVVGNGKRTIQLKFNELSYDWCSQIDRTTAKLNKLVETPSFGKWVVVGTHCDTKSRIGACRSFDGCGYFNRAVTRWRELHSVVSTAQ